MCLNMLQTAFFLVEEKQLSHTIPHSSSLLHSYLLTLLMVEDCVAHFFPLWVSSCVTGFKETSLALIHVYQNLTFKLFMCGRDDYISDIKNVFLGVLKISQWTHVRSYVSGKLCAGTQRMNSEMLCLKLWCDVQLIIGLSNSRKIVNKNKRWMTWRLTCTTWIFSWSDSFSFSSSSSLPPLQTMASVSYSFRHKLCLSDRLARRTTFL